MLLTHYRSADRRPGMILIIVVACLSLFLAVGIAFIFYAHSQANSMRLQRERSNGGIAANVNQGSLGYTDESPPQAIDLANMALSQLIYDKPDPVGNSYNFSAMYGHSLARAMYGGHSTGGNTVSYDGIGRIHTTPTDLYTHINYTYFNHSPHHKGGSFPQQVLPEQEAGAGIYIAKNAPYTYPDENNCYLAALDLKTGKVLVPSFHRPWLPGANNFTNSKNPSLLRAALPHPPIANLDATGAPDGTYGDVENLLGKQVPQYDSMWIDLDAPVHTWRGRHYKPLFAFLVIDLDGRLNVNVAQDVKDSSNQGWGPWEMTLDPLVNNAGVQVAQARGYSGAYPTASYSIDGSATNVAPGGGGAPSTSGVDFDGYNAQQYAMSQFRTSPTWPGEWLGGNDTERKHHPLLYNPYFADRITAATPRTPNVSFPVDDMYYLNNIFFGDAKTDYANAALSKSATSLQSPLFGGSRGGTPAQPNFRYMLTTYSNDLQRPGMRPWATQNSINAHSYSALPVAPSSPETGLPTGPAIDLPKVPTPTSTSVPGGEFGANWRSLIASALGSIDLNRKVSDYRVDPTKPFESQGNVTASSFQRAEADRQQLAMDIFVRLLAVTGVMAPTNLTPPYTAGGGLAAQLKTMQPAQLSTCRHLAQIAVNIVDYIDFDDYMTPFNWNPNFSSLTDLNAMKQGWVFGTEIPRLVINEVYAVWENTNADLTNTPVDPVTMKKYANGPYQLQFYAELHNPMTPDGNAAGAGYAQMSYSNGGAALEDATGRAIYRLLITPSSNTTNLRASDNVLGVTDEMYSSDLLNPKANSQTHNVTPLGDRNRTIPPSNHTQGSVPGMGQTQGSNPSFYLIGPKDIPTQTDVLPGNANPPVPLSYQTAQMQMAYPTNAMNLSTPPPGYTILVQRLACPQMPASVTNPYVTVDYTSLTSQQIWDHRTFLTKADMGNMNSPNPNQKSYDQQCSFGRIEPYAANVAPSIFVAQGTPGMNPPPAAPPPLDKTVLDNKHQTFFLQNIMDATTGQSMQTFNWLLHLDRSLVSPVEIACVSVWKPHELTQQFVSPPIGGMGANVPQCHMGDWFNDNTDPSTGVPATALQSNRQRLYRAFSVLETGSRVYGMPFGGRIPGKININTVWHEQILQAACALTATGPSVNHYTSTDVHNFWNAISTGRTLTAVNGSDHPTIWSGTPGHPNGLNDPIVLPPGAAGYADASAANGAELQFQNRGVQNTILNLAKIGSLPANTHPYTKMELVNKIYNNFTTRSNTFAVWCTIGYFEVTNDGPYNIVNPNSGHVTNLPVLGNELGIADGSNIRHKFFAIIDRTNLTLDSTGVTQGLRPVFLSYEPMNQPNPATNPTTANLVMPDPYTAPNPPTGTTEATSLNIQVPALITNAAKGTPTEIFGIYDGQPWTLNLRDPNPLNLHVLLDVGPNQETVNITGFGHFTQGQGCYITVSPLSGKFQYPHARGCVMQLFPSSSTLGNPGPQPSFNVKDPRYSAVVPYFLQVN